MNEDDHISDDERELFRDAMSDVKPLKNTPNKPLPVSPKKSADHSKTITIKPFRIRKRHTDEQITAKIHHKTVSGDDVLSYHQHGLQHRLKKQFRQGKFRIEATLDLHSHTAEAAIMATHDFLENCVHKSYRVIRLIHGKGKSSSEAPVIKNILNTYLRHHENVLAFHSAQPKDGGTGALYVLLKK